MSHDYIRKQINASISVKHSILSDDAFIEQINLLANECLKCLISGGKIILAGNGGSFADAQHLSAEFVARFVSDRKPLASLVLGMNSSTITAIGNDYSYEHVFARELLGLGNPLDLFIPISTSGNSLNILLAVAEALKLGIQTIGLTGENGGKLLEMCQCLCVPSPTTAFIQEAHIMIGHIVCGIVESYYANHDI